MTKSSRRLAVRRTKTGLGLFALEPIPKGKRIIEYVGRLIPNEVVEKSRGRYFFGVNTKWSIDGSARSNTARYINHSCRPNAEAFVSGHRVWIWSKRNIRAGEEITSDYGKEYFDSYIEPVGCKCAECDPPAPARGRRGRAVSGASPAASKGRGRRPSRP